MGEHADQGGEVDGGLAGVVAKGEGVADVEEVEAFEALLGVSGADHRGFDAQGCDAIMGEVEGRPFARSCFAFCVGASVDELGVFSALSGGVEE